MDSPSLAANTSASGSSPSPFEPNPHSLESPSLDYVQVASPVEEPDLYPNAETDLARAANAAINDQKPLETMSKLLKGKEKEWASTASKTPLRLLDLPVDILKEIIHQVRRSTPSVCTGHILILLSYPILMTLPPSLFAIPPYIVLPFRTFILASILCGPMKVPILSPELVWTR